MIRAMRTAATGMKAQQMNVDNIANNLANVNTTAFKKSKIEFQDIFYEVEKSAGNPGEGGPANPSLLEIGYGSNPVATQRQFSQGELMQTGNSTDVAIMGDGFFKLLLPDGGEAYTRDGSFKISAAGELSTTDGYLLEPAITLPENTQQLTIGPDGTVSAAVGADTFPQVIGQIETVRFINPSGLSAIGRNLYVLTPASGEALTATPGSDGMGRLSQGYLETSNVEIVEEMIDLITAQRAYEINSRSVRAAEEMMSQANDLVR